MVAFLKLDIQMAKGGAIWHFAPSVTRLELIDESCDCYVASEIRLTLRTICVITEV